MYSSSPRPCEISDERLPNFSDFSGLGGHEDAHIESQDQCRPQLPIVTVAFLMSPVTPPVTIGLNPMQQSLIDHEL